MMKFNMATIGSSVVKAIVSRDRKQFIAKAIVEFGLMMVMLTRNLREYVCTDLYISGR